MPGTVLKISLLADTEGLSDGFGEAVKMSERADKQISSFRPPAMTGMGDAGGIAEIGNQIRGALMQGMAPLNGFAQRFEKQFDRVGGTIVTLARRIDASMKFPAVDGFLEKVQNKLPEGFGKATVGAVRFFNKVKNTLSSLGDVAGKGLGKISGNGVPGGVIGSYAKLTVTVTGIAPAARAATKATKSLVTQVASMFGLFSGAAAVVTFFAKGIRGAIGLGETVNKVDVVFGKSTDVVKKNADEMAKAYGLPKQAILDASSSIGAIGKASGLTQEKAAGVSVEMANLAANASSLYHVPLEDALSKIRSGLVGQSEPLREWIGEMSEAKVEAEASRLGFQKSAKGLSENAKFAARSSLITKGLADASGDLAATQGSAANQANKFTGTIGNIATSIGGALMPAVETVLRGFNSFAGGIASFVESNQAGFQAIGGWISGAFANFGEGVTNIVSALGTIPAAFNAAFGGAPSTMIQDLGAKIGEVVDAIGFAWRNLPAIVGIAFVRIREGAINLGEWIGVIPENLQQLGTYIAGNWKKLIIDAVSAVGQGFMNLGKNIWNLGSAIVEFMKNPTKGFQFKWTSLTEGFEATAAKLPDIIKPHLTSLQGEIDAKLDQIAQAELKRSKAIADKAKEDAKPKPDRAIPKGPMGESEAPAAIKFASSAELGSKEAYSAIIQAKAGRTPGMDAAAKVAAESLTESRKQTGILQTIAASGQSQNRRQVEFAL